MKRHALIACGLLIAVLAGIFATGCSKKDSPAPANGFKATDFSVTVTGKRVVSSGSNLNYVEVTYEVKNLTSRNYEDTRFYINWKVKATDGTLYADERLVETPLGGGQTAAEETHIDITYGKTMDLNSLTYTVIDKP